MSFVRHADYYFYSLFFGVLSSPCSFESKTLQERVHDFRKREKIYSLDNFFFALFSSFIVGKIRAVQRCTYSYFLLAKSQQYFYCSFCSSPDGVVTLRRYNKTRREGLLLQPHLFGQMDFWGKVLSILTLITSAFALSVSRELRDADDIIPFLCALIAAQ